VRRICLLRRVWGACWQALVVVSLVTLLACGRSTELLELEQPSGHPASISWRNLSPNLFSVHFVNEHQGWVVGLDGTIAATADGGLTWSNQSSGTEHLSSVHFVNERQGWAVGSGGTIVGTVDGGLTWSKQSSDTEAYLLSVHFVNERQGWAVGDDDTIVATADGGLTWSDQSSQLTVSRPQGNPFGGNSRILGSVHFVNERQGWAVGWYGTIVATEDGGLTWSQQNSGTGKFLRSVHFVNERQGWAVSGYGPIVATTDGGLTWSTQSSGTYADLASVYFVNERQGWAVGMDNTIVATVDGGLTWSTQSLPRSSSSSSYNAIQSMPVRWRVDGTTGTPGVGYVWKLSRRRTVAPDLKNDRTPLSISPRRSRLTYPATSSSPGTSSRRLRGLLGRTNRPPLAYGGEPPCDSSRFGVP
jgi:photosystem II stability/assembly factor-like uncharacterized protein